MKLRDLKQKKVIKKAVKQDVVKDVTMTGAVSEVFRFYASKGL